MFSALVNEYPVALVIFNIILIAILSMDHVFKLRNIKKNYIFLILSFSIIGTSILSFFKDITITSFSELLFLLLLIYIVEFLYRYLKKQKN